MKKLLLAFTCVCALILSLTLTSCKNGWITNVTTYYDNSEKYVVGTFDTEEKVTTLNIDWICGDIDLVKKEDSTKIELKEYAELEDDLRVHSYFENGTYFVRFMKSGFRIVNLETEKKKLTVYYPADFENVVVKLTSGTFKTDKISCNELLVDITSGDVNIDEVSATNKLNVKLTSGDVNFNKVTSANILISFTSGDVNMKNINTTELNAYLTSGDLNLDFETVSKSYLEMTSGDIRLSFKESGATVAIDKTSGDLHFNQYTDLGNQKYKIGNGEADFRIKLTSGDVYIK